MTLIEKGTEALIFAAAEAVSGREIASALQEVSGQEVNAADVDGAVEELNARYEAAEHAFRIERWAGGYRMATVSSVAPFLRTLQAQQQERRLSRSLMETLAVVAYRQPVTKPEIDYVRGVNSDYAVRKLLELGFLLVAGRSEAVGKPLLYATSAEFLDRFGLNSLEDLPKPREIQDLLNDPAFTQERTTLRDLDWTADDAEPRTSPEDHSEAEA